jgi:hypothetical protein
MRLDPAVVRETNSKNSEEERIDGNVTWKVGSREVFFIYG